MDAAHLFNRMESYALLEQALRPVPEGWRGVVWSIASSGKSYQCDAIGWVGEVWEQIERGLTHNS